MRDSVTDRDWEQFGATDPYYYVITHDEYRKGNLTEERKAEFFRTGRIYVEEILGVVHDRIDPSFRPKRALDFGCGVGRVCIPLAKHAEHVVGADVSESMLEEARRNCEREGAGNVSFVRSDDTLASVDGSFDFIHSFIVFQHIPVERGEALFERLLERLEEGGVCVAHFTYAKSYRTKSVIPWIKRRVPLARAIINLIRGRRHDAPEMQVNDYDLNRLFLLVQRRGVRSVHVHFTDHGGDLGILAYFRKPWGARGIAAETSRETGQ